MPNGDLLIHVGDVSRSVTIAELLSVFAWLDAQPHARIVAVPGNHDFAIQRELGLCQHLRVLFPRIRLLIDAGDTLDDMPIWGSPWQPWFGGWAYNFRRGSTGEEEARSTWSAVPKDTVILVTHSPARGVLDRTTDGLRAGCAHLRARIRALRDLRLHVFGHIHEAYGIQINGPVRYVNAAICDARYRLVRHPIVLEM